MQLPIVAQAPVVATHAEAFRDLFENQRQFGHFKNYLTGLIALDNKSMAKGTFPFSSHPEGSLPAILSLTRVEQLPYIN